MKKKIFAGLVASAFVCIMALEGLLASTVNIRMQIGNNTAEIDGKNVTLSSCPLMHNDVAMIPADFVQKAFGAQVQFDGTNINMSYEGLKTPKVIFRDSKNTRTYGNCNQKNDPILRLIRESSKSIHVEIDVLTDSLIINELIRASKRGVDVKIFLDSNLKNISNATGYDHNGEKIMLVLENIISNADDISLGKWKVWGKDASFENNQKALVVTSMEKVEKMESQEQITCQLIDIFDIGWGSKERTLESNGAQIRWHDEKQYTKMNRRFAVFDEKTVWLGSSSWSWSNFEGDSESEIIITSHEISKEFTTQFIQDWGISSQSFGSDLK